MEDITQVIQAVQINIPFNMLQDRLEDVIQYRLNPEIYLDARTLDQISIPAAQTLADRLLQSSSRITFHGSFMDLSPGGMDEKIVEVTRHRFRQVMDLASVFHPEVVVFHSGYDRWRFNGNVDLWLSTSLATWEPLTELAEQCNTCIALENIFDHSPENLIQLLEKIDSPRLRLCFDIGHWWIFSKISLREWLSLWAPYIVEFHIHDNNRESDQHLPPGEGEINFQEFSQLVEELSLSAIITLEPHSEKVMWRILQSFEDPSLQRLLRVCTR